MKTEIGERIRAARDNKELDQTTLSDKIGVVMRTLQRWEKGEQIPAGDYLVAIAKYTGVRPEWLLTGEGEMYPAPIDPTKNIFKLHRDTLTKGIPLVTIPVFASVPAGKTAAIFHPDYAERYVTVDNIRDPSAFALVVKGNSMSPKIEDGDIVVVSPKQDVRSGDICVIRVNEEDVLKKVKIEQQYVHLIPLNPAFEPVTVRKRDISFLGKVVKVIKSL
ncbi:MAG TPA: XRE family transcriptional regulator [Bacteroidota bacterium]|nr:XRE family transcriptional regulator [Bacteroidota bacterium]